MSLAIVLGYSGSKRTDEVTNLYTGTDLGEARRLLDSPPEGIGRTELIVNPAHSRRKFHGTTEVAEAPAEAPAEELPEVAPEALAQVLPEAPAEESAEESGHGRKSRK